MVAALASSLGVLVLGRAMQGVGLGLVPQGMATARDELPPERVPAAIGLLSVAGAAGVGAGYPVSGLLAGISLSAAFWFGAVAVLPGRGPGGGAEPTASELRREREEAELASAGLPGVRPE